jgi:hypothetical protein
LLEGSRRKGLDPPTLLGKGLGEGKGIDLSLSTDNEVGLAWLEGALEHAYARGQTQLLAYLEVVMEEVLFEMELEFSS